ncbi:MAG TPA: (Fe-S)-binding protein [Planctomycetota bacterium]|nr:(Fe-S)-binding protein [Planctomycetota bacterium]
MKGGADRTATAARAKRVALFVTCVVDQCWPGIGIAAATLLEHVGCEVEVGETTCCGQPFCNSGYPAFARPLAKALIGCCERMGVDALVLPSGSCAAQITHYPQLFAHDPAWRQRAEHLAERTFELSQFLVWRGMTKAPGRLQARVGWHDGCHGLRELGVGQEPRQLLRTVAGVEFVELRAADACCGFGGTFAVKLPELSVAIADHKLAQVEAARIEVLASGDASCLLHLRGRLEHRAVSVRTMHLAEVLAHGLYG